MLKCVEPLDSTRDTTVYGEPGAYSLLAVYFNSDSSRDVKGPLLIEPVDGATATYTWTYHMGDVPYQGSATAEVTDEKDESWNRDCPTYLCDINGLGNLVRVVGIRKKGFTSAA